MSWYNIHEDYMNVRHELPTMLSMFPCDVVSHIIHYLDMDHFKTPTRQSIKQDEPPPLIRKKNCRRRLVFMDA